MINWSQSRAPWRLGAGIEADPLLARREGSVGTNSESDGGSSRGRAVKRSPSRPDVIMMNGSTATKDWI
jgi:hypothetical protein